MFPLSTLTSTLRLPEASGSRKSSKSVGSSGTASQRVCREDLAFHFPILLFAFFTVSMYTKQRHVKKGSMNLRRYKHPCICWPVRRSCTRTSGLQVPGARVSGNTRWAKIFGLTRAGLSYGLLLFRDHGLRVLMCQIHVRRWLPLCSCSQCFAHSLFWGTCIRPVARFMSSHRPSSLSHRMCRSAAGHSDAQSAQTAAVLPHEAPKSG